MTLDEARTILHRWDKRKPGERDFVLAADKLLAEAWEEPPRRRAEKAPVGLQLNLNRSA